MAQRKWFTGKPRTVERSAQNLTQYCDWLKKVNERDNTKRPSNPEDIIAEYRKVREAGVNSHDDWKRETKNTILKFYNDKKADGYKINACRTFSHRSTSLLQPKHGTHQRSSQTTRPKANPRQRFHFQPRNPKKNVLLRVAIRENMAKLRYCENFVFVNLSDGLGQLPKLTIKSNLVEYIELFHPEQYVLVDNCKFDFFHRARKVTKSLDGTIKKSLFLPIKVGVTEL